MSKSANKNSSADLSKDNLNRIFPAGDLADAGEYPYTRGIHKNMYRSRLWTMRQYAGFGNAKATNQRFNYLLSQGTTGLSVAFDLPTQMGRDSDHKVSVGEVGKVGVAISSMQDIEELFSNIPLDRVSISMTINSTANILLAMLCVLAKKNNIALNKLQGTTQNDILKEYIARGTYVYPPAGAIKLTTDLIDFCKQEVPNWNTVSISGYHIREAGSDAIQEVAFTLADGICYVESALSAGLTIDDFAPRLSFFFNCHNNFFEEIAKFRAARTLWAKIIKERFKSNNPKSQQLRFHTQTAGSSLTAQQPLNNIVRTTLQALAAVLGGTQSLHTNGFDEALGLPSELSATIALRTQQIIAHEAGVTQIVDPLGGSGLIESLTQNIELEAQKIIDKIDQLGGMVKAIELNYPQSEIEKNAYHIQRQIESKEQIIVGVNEFFSANEEQFKVEPKNTQDEIDQVNRLEKYKKSRDPKLLKKVLDELSLATKENKNTLPYIINALQSQATLGEISDCFRDIFGEYQPN